jgi:hypothetical protein
VRPLAFYLVLLLAACAGSTTWVKQGVSEEARASDLAACRAEARTALSRDEAIDSDILATQAHDLRRIGAFEIRRDAMAEQNRARSDEIVGRCMTGKGYARASD